MSSVSLVFFLLISFILAASLSMADEPAPTTNKEEVTREAAEALDAAKRYSAQERAQLERKIQGELDEIQAGIRTLQARLEDLSGETRAHAEATIADLEKRKDEARRKLEEIGTAGEVAWERLRKGLESTMEELLRLYHRVVPPK